MDVLTFFAFLTCLLCSIEANKNNKIMMRFPKNEAPSTGTSTRIFGGTPAKENEFPYSIFAIVNTNVMTSCTASLIRVDRVLLAAHCVPGNVLPSNVLLAAGKPDLTKYMAFRRSDFSSSIDEKALGVQERRGDKIFISDQFNSPDTLEHDMAIIFVKKPFELSSSVNVIPIATDKLTDRTRCTILGWGLTEGQTMSPVLLYSPSAYVVPLESCKYKKSGPFICLERSRSGICQGDSGSPLVCNGKVYGVASHVLASASIDECGNDMEEVYAEIFDELSWINSKLTDVSVDTDSEQSQGGTSGAKEFLGCSIFIAYLAGLTFVL